MPIGGIISYLVGAVGNNNLEAKDERLIQLFGGIQRSTFGPPLGTEGNEEIQRVILGSAL